MLTGNCKMLPTKGSVLPVLTSHSNTDENTIKIFSSRRRHTRCLSDWSSDVWLFRSDLARDSLVAKKAWFFFDDSYVALGAGINLPGDSEHGVATDINQTRLAGNVFTNQSTDPLTSGVHTYTSRGAAWVYHNRVGYILGPDSRFVVSNGPQTGSWSDIGMGSNQPVTLPVFDLWIDHGDSPEGATYEYTLFPNATKYQVAERARLPKTHVLANSEAIQAVYNMKLRLVEAAFRKPGSLTTPLGRIQVDHSCLLIIEIGRGSRKQRF